MFFADDDHGILPKRQTKLSSTLLASVYYQAPSYCKLNVSDLINHLVLIDPNLRRVLQTKLEI